MLFLYPFFSTEKPINFKINKFLSYTTICSFLSYSVFNEHIQVTLQGRYLFTLHYYLLLEAVRLLGGG